MNPKRAMTSSVRLTLTALLTALASLFWACQERTGTPTSGTASVSVGEEVLPLIRDAETVFEDLYRDAKIDIRPTTSREAIAELFDDSVKTIVSARPLNDEERRAQAELGLEISGFRIARDAVCVIVNNANPVSRLRLSQVDSMFTGAIRDWGLAGWSGAPGRIMIALPDRNMASYEVFASRVLTGGVFTEPDTILGSTGEMIDLVAGQPLAVGIAGLNWLRENKDRVRALELTNPFAHDSLGISGKYIYPHQAYIYKEYYPIIRDVYVYSTPDSYGVGSGFTSFLTGAQGQRIVLNQGLVPATMPVRLVELKNENL